MDTEPRAFSLDGCAASGDESLGAKTPAWLREAADALDPLPEAMAMQQPALADSPEPLEEEEKQEEGVGVVEEEAVAARTASPEMDGGSAAVGWEDSAAVGANVWQEEDGAWQGGGRATPTMPPTTMTCRPSRRVKMDAMRGAGWVARSAGHRFGSWACSSSSLCAAATVWRRGYGGGGRQSQRARGGGAAQAAKREQAVDGAQAATALWRVCMCAAASVVR